MDTYETPDATMPERTTPRPDPALARLAREIALNRPFRNLAEGALLAYAWTWDRLDELGRGFFARFDLTEAQFNVLMILDDHPDRRFRQHELASLLVVNRASAGNVLERMERKGLIARTQDPEDRRAMRVALTREGKARLDEVKGPYYRLLGRLLAGEDERSLRQVVAFCERLRAAIESNRKQAHSSAKE
jgi:DNA-binding MarR family transcriptional regulator